MATTPLANRHGAPVNPEVMARAARNRAGISQREMARRAGVSTATVEAIEAGRQQPSARVLGALLAVAALELSVDRPVQALCPHTAQHLHHSLSSRLHLALGGSGRPYDRPFLPAWQQLGLLSLKAPVHLTGDLAVAVWIPMPPPPARVSVATDGRLLLPPLPDLEVVREPRPPSCTVGVVLTPGLVTVPPPGELALDPRHAPWRRALRSVAAALDEEAARDRAGRRSPAHREPRRRAEEWRLLFARPWSPKLLPPDRWQARGWRLDDEVGMDEWIERRAARR